MKSATARSILAIVSLFTIAAKGQDAAKDVWTKLVGPKFSKRPAFQYVKNNAKLPNVLIYGDSISIGYTPQVRKKLAGKANVYRLHCNGGDTSRVISAMTKMHKTMDAHWKFKWDVIHFNCGLHDLKYLTEQKKLDIKNGKQVRSREDYAKNLKAIFAHFKKIAPDAKIIFATTTPVPAKSGGRKAGDAAEYNETALAVLKDYPEITVNDLYELTMPNQSKWWTRPGNVHFNKTGVAAQGDQVADVILKALGKK